MKINKQTLTIVNRTYEALDNLYLNCRDMQKNEFAIQTRKTNPLAHAKEYGTIKLTTARQSGHSRAIARFIAEHNMSFATICSSLTASHYLRDKIYEYAKKKNVMYGHIISDVPGYSRLDKVEIVTAIQVNKKETYMLSSGNYDTQLRGLSVDAIICDISCMLSQKSIDEIYRVGLPCMADKPFVYFMFIE